MKRYASVCALALIVGACSGSNPFATVDTTDPGPGPGATPSGVPVEIQNSLTSFEYNEGAGTLTVTGISLDEEDVSAPYRRRAFLDITAPDGSVAYEAYTAQDDPLDEHTTAYVKSISDVTAAVAVTGGQFTFYDGGALYARSGSFDPPTVSESGDTGLVSYAGSYIGLSNVNGPNTDLAPTAGAPPTAILPSQTAQVNGSIFINVDFVDNDIKGIVYNRVLQASTGAEVVPDLILVPTDVATDGSFTSTVEIPGRIEVGTYAGILGGVDSEAIAGGLFVDDHFDDSRNGEEEYGIFVLGQCGTAANNDPALCASGAAE